MRHNARVRRIFLAALLTVGCDCGGRQPGGAGDSEPLPLCPAEPLRSGVATYYAADGSGNCSYERLEGEVLVAALSNADYDGAAACGACLEVEGPGGAVVVRVVDRCPGCKPGSVDLSPSAFAAIAEPEDGRVPVSWRVVPCEVEGPMAYRFKDGSNPFWTALQVRNHRHPIATLEARRAGGEYARLRRQTYNYFVDSGGLGGEPIDLRITDRLGNVVEEHGIEPGDAVVRTGEGQLPACRRPDDDAGR